MAASCCAAVLSPPRRPVRNENDSEARETPTWYPDPDEVRAELQAILAQMRAAKSMPWDDDRTALYRTIFPQMTGCLPDTKARICASTSRPNWRGSKRLSFSLPPSSGAEGQAEPAG